MKTNHNIEEAVVNALQERSNQVITPLSLKQNIDKQIDQKIMEEHYRMKHFNIKKTVCLVAACCLVLSMGVFAAGKVTGYLSSTKPSTNYDSYSDMAKVEKAAGFQMKSVEYFTNGYQFKNMRVNTTDKTDADYNVIGSFQECNITYGNNKGESISLCASEKQEEPADSTSTPTASTTINGITVNYYVDHYKFVPENYELTDEDKANEAKGNYYISYGSDEVEETDYITVDWIDNNISYFFQSNGASLGSDELFDMAKEVINQ